MVPESHTSGCRSHKFGRVAYAAQQAASAMQSLQKGGAQALLAPIGQAAPANAVGKLPGGAAAVNAYDALRAGKPVIVASSSSLPRSAATQRRRRAALDPESIRHLKT